MLKCCEHSGDTQGLGRSGLAGRCMCPIQNPPAGTWRSRSAPASAHTGSVGWGQGAWPWFAGWMWLLTTAVHPEEHRGFPGVASGSWVLQSPSSKGFVVLSVSVSPWGRSQEQHRLEGGMGDCGHRAQLWLRAGDPPGATGVLLHPPVRPWGFVSVPGPALTQVGVQSGCQGSVARDRDPCREA